MKKLLIFSLLIFMLIITGCESTDTYEYKETEEVEVTTPVQNANVVMTLESCSYTKEISAKDKERSGSVIPEKEGKIYVDAVFYVSENDVVITEDDFTAELKHDGKDYEYGFCYEATDYSGIKANTPYPANTVSRIHIFFVLPEEASLVDEEQAVKISAFGKDYDAIVVISDNSDPLSTKTELKVSDSHSASNGISFTVKGIETGKYLSSSAEGGAEYKGSSDFHELIIELTNNTNEPISDLYTYSFNAGGAIKANIQREINNNTDLASLSDNPVASGETAILHIYLYTEDTDGIIRLNVGTDCYYCKMQ